MMDFFLSIIYMCIGLYCLALAIALLFAVIRLIQLGSVKELIEEMEYGIWMKNRFK